MTEGGDIAPECSGERGKRGGLGLERKPGDERASFGGPARPAGGEQLFLAQAVAAAHIGYDVAEWGRAAAVGLGFEDRFDEIGLTHDAGIGFPAIERLVVPFGLAIIDEAGIAGAGSAPAGAELPQHPVGGQPRQIIVSKIGPVAAIGVSGGLLDHAGAHRVQVDVAHQCQSVAILIDEVGFEAALEEMSGALEPRVEVAGVAEGEVLHARGQRLIADLERQVQVIGHQAEGVYPVAETRDTLGHELIEAAAIFRGKEDVLPGVAAQDDVVEAAGDVQARLAGHAGRLTEWRLLCN